MNLWFRDLKEKKPSGKWVSLTIKNLKLILTFIKIGSQDKSLNFQHHIELVDFMVEYYNEENP